MGWMTETRGFCGYKHTHSQELGIDRLVELSISQLDHRSFHLDPLCYQCAIEPASPTLDATTHDPRPTMSGTYKGPINPNPQNGEAGIIIYGYVPSIGLAATAVATFSIVLLVNSWYLWKKRGKGYRSFHWLIIVGSVSR